MEVNDGDDCLKVIIEEAATYTAADKDPSTNVQQILFSCSECSLDFPDLQQFQAHLKIHDPKSVPCPLCGSLFRRRDHMRRHLKTVHSADHPAPCPKCQQVFTEEKTLTQHMRDQHPHEHEYDCTECRYSTDTLKNLVSHKKSHVLANKYVCDVCCAIFKRQDHLNRHKRSLHLNEFVKCKVCKQIFKRRDHMLRHMRDKHKVANATKVI